MLKALNKLFSRKDLEEKVLDLESAKVDLTERLAIADAKLEGCEHEIFNLQVERDQLSKDLANMTADRDRHRERNTRLEMDARDIAVEGILLRAHEIKRDTRVLLVSTPNVSLLNHGSFANLMNRLQNICRHLDMVTMFHGDIKMENITEEKAVEKYHMVVIPTKYEWENKRSAVIERLSKVFDEKAK